MWIKHIYGLYTYLMTILQLTTTYATNHNNSDQYHECWGSSSLLHRAIRRHDVDYSSGTYLYQFTWLFKHALWFDLLCFVSLVVFTFSDPRYLCSLFDCFSRTSAIILLTQFLWSISNKYVKYIFSEIIMKNMDNINTREIRGAFQKHLWALKSKSS